MLQQALKLDFNKWRCVAQQLAQTQWDREDGVLVVSKVVKRWVRFLLGYHLTKWQKTAASVHHSDTVERHGVFSLARIARRMGHLQLANAMRTWHIFAQVHPWVHPPGCCVQWYTLVAAC